MVSIGGFFDLSPITENNFYDFLFYCVEEQELSSVIKK